PDRHVALVLVHREVLLLAHRPALLDLLDRVALGAHEPGALDVLLGVVDVPAVVVVAADAGRTAAEDEVQVVGAVLGHGSSSVLGAGGSGRWALRRPAGSGRWSRSRSTTRTGRRRTSRAAAGPCR